MATEGFYDISSFLLYFGAWQSLLTYIQGLLHRVTTHSFTASKVKGAMENILLYIFKPPASIDIQKTHSMRKIFWEKDISGSWCLPDCVNTCFLHFRLTHTSITFLFHYYHLLAYANLTILLDDLLHVITLCLPVF